MKVFNWGGDLAVVLPKELVEKMSLSAGDELDIVDVVEHTLVVQKEDQRKAALERLASRNWTLSSRFTSSIATRRTSGEGVFTRRQVMSATAKLIMEGDSQVVLLPEEFRFLGTEVRVSKVGDKVILEPVDKKPFDAAAWRAGLEDFRDIPFMEDGRDQGE
jgi:antitoxin MazE